MLSFFPRCYEDELLFSALGRYHNMSGNKSYKATLLELFGTHTVRSVVDLPCHIQNLCKRISVGEYSNTSIIIKKHTLLPYYAPFLPECRVRTIWESMNGNGGRSVHYQAGIMASGIHSPVYLRYCTLCVKEDDNKLGQPYWHRVHQLPGVLLCPIHGVTLNDSTVPFTLRFNSQKFEVLSSCVVAHSENEFEYDERELNHLKYISSESYWLLNCNEENQSCNDIKSFYQNCLNNMGFITEMGRTRFQDLIPAFISFYGISFLERMNSNLHMHDQDTWLHKVLRKPRVSCHPLRHILLLRFFNKSVASLITGSLTKESSLPFGSGPWPCVNKAASHYHELVVVDCKIKFNTETGQPMGTFTCNCGFVYTRNGPDSANEQIYVGRVKQFGELWMNTLKDLSMRPVSLRQMARTLGVDTRTVKKHLHDIKTPINHEVCNTSNFGDKTNIFREEWIAHMTSHPTYSRTELRRTNPKIYSWLYRHDRTWLMNNLPQRRSAISSYSRVDWSQRDTQLASLVVKAVDDLHTVDPPVRITTSRIGKYIQQLCLIEEHLDKLPKTKLQLERLTETVEQFRIRRVHVIAENLRSKGAVLQHWKLVREAGLRPDYGPSVEMSIQAEIGTEWITDGIDTNMEA